MRVVRAVVPVVTMVAVLTAACGSSSASGPSSSAPSSSASSRASAPPTARHVTSIPAVGALFVPGVLGTAVTLHLPHYCSGSVLTSVSRDLVLTAAHCVFGRGTGLEFVPGFHDGVAPYGSWDVTTAYLSAAWGPSHDPHDDVAVLRVRPHGSSHVQDATGGYTLADAPIAGTRLTVDGYPAGSDGRPITCTARVYRHAGYPAFDCGGFADGVSGGPWLVGRHVVGAVGGLHQGGCTPSTSYSAPFGAQVRALLARAEADGPGDRAPLPTGDGC